MDEIAPLLGAATRALPGGGEDRPGQRAMADAVAAAIEHERHLVVQAGTGTGKSLAYLVPAIASGRRVVVATATKALQDQLAGKDLPFLAAAGLDVEWAVLKGRSNYLCLQRVREASSAGADGRLEGMDDLSPGVRGEIARLRAWAGTTTTGDAAELDWSPAPRAWSAVSVGSEECPGACRCPMGDACFAETARRRADTVDVVVVNTHLYGVHLATGGTLLPEHDVVVFDEAHLLEDVISATSGLTLSAGRFAALARTARTVVADDALVGELAGAGTILVEALGAYLGRRLPAELPAPLADALVVARGRVERLQAALREIDTSGAGGLEEVRQKVLRTTRITTGVLTDLAAAAARPEGSVAWVEGGAHEARLQVAPIDIAEIVRAGVFDQRTAVLTSATIPASLPERVGLLPGRHDVIDVGSPFDYATNALLYCAMHLPDPRRPGFEPAAHDELEALITAAGGRTLALFTSWRAMDAAAAALAPRLPFRILTQSELPKPKLIAEFTRDETSCLFATAGFFSGIDVPGATLSLVTIDKLPFARPDDPLLEARRERAGAAAFRTIDLPRAATLLAQAAGRLIRTASDRGVVAVLDNRLGTAGYRWDIVRALPPMRRTRHRADVEAFLDERS